MRPDGCQQGCFDLICSCSATPTPSYDDEGRRVFEARGNGRGLLVVEGRPGRSGLPPGIVLEAQGTERPDLWIESSRTLGNGSTAVCDKGPEQPIGGVPSIEPPDFGPDLAITGVLQDFACRFAVQPSPDDACTLDNFGDFDFVSSRSTIQFCNQVSSAAAFPSGLTVLTARLRDVDGNLGPTKQIVIVNPVSSSPAE